MYRKPFAVDSRSVRELERQRLSEGELLCFLGFAHRIDSVFLRFWAGWIASAYVTRGRGYCKRVAPSERR